MTDSKIIGHYKLGQTIGEGTFGKVKLAIHLLTQEKVAVKILEKDKIKEQADLERIAREINILKQLSHPNIIQLYEIVETPQSLYLITEFAEGGELFDYIVKHQRVTETEAARFLHQIISGVAYLHQLGIIHRFFPTHHLPSRDLKPENLLLNEQRNIKIVDFGLSNFYQQGQFLKTACGSPCYAAPEMIAGREYNPLAADIWSCGVILYAMLCGYLPFEDPVTANLYRKIVQGEYSVPKFVTPLARDLIRCVLNTDPAKRFTIEEVLEHPWIGQWCSESKLIEGFIFGKDQFQIDPVALDQLKQFNFQVDYSRQCLELNKHNPVTATYYLLKRKAENNTALQMEQRIKQFLDQRQHRSVSQKVESNQRHVSASIEKKADNLFPKHHHLKTETPAPHPDKAIRTQSFHEEQKTKTSSRIISQYSSVRQNSSSTTNKVQFNSGLSTAREKPQQSPQLKVKYTKSTSTSPMRDILKVKLHKGAFNFAQLQTNTTLKQIATKIKLVLSKENFQILQYQNEKPYEWRVEKNETILDILICLLQETQNIFVVKCLKVKGAPASFADLYQRILSEVNKC